MNWYKDVLIKKNVSIITIFKLKILWKMIKKLGLLDKKGNIIKFFDFNKIFLKKFEKYTFQK